MTEAEFQLAAYGCVQLSEDCPSPKPYPWGSDSLYVRNVNADFRRWTPQPVNRSQGSSVYGARDLVGNGWEWTSTLFAPLPNFSAYIESYPGYSADFFDGKHYVMKGASWA